MNTRGADPPRPPSVDSLARSIVDSGLPHPLRVDAARAALDRGDPAAASEEAQLLGNRLLQPVINATGVLLHTNLGRAPLAFQHAANYTNLELDLSSGGRGSRQDRVGPLLARACGAEAAIVVNNGAAALLVVLAAVAAGRSTAVSRGELIEIGGGFRLPEVMALSGTHLVEVGTTNRTRLGDYRAAAGDAALLLKVHTSNFRITGFSGAVDVADLASLEVPVVVDVGSGLLDASCPWLPDGPPGWLASEPAVRQSLEAGAALVTFSGDKLLGGPQAGIIAGRADLVAACGAHPLYRACRPGGLVLAALQATALAYLERRAAGLPFWRMATIPEAMLRERAESIAAGCHTATAAPCASVAGGGALPGIEIPSWALRLAGDHRDALRRTSPRPIIARVRNDETVLDLRTLERDDDIVVATALAAL